MKFAPVIIPTLCRFEQFKSCIMSLQRNKHASATELYIGLDYPAQASHWHGYQKIREFINAGIDGFSQVNIIEQKQNKGWYQNYNELRNEVYKSYDRYIYTEDDNIFSPDFLDYMNKNLEKYQDDGDILAVSGYSYPIDWKKNGEAANLVKIDAYFSAWGYGIWKSKEDAMFKFITTINFDKLMKNTIFMYRLHRCARNQFCNFVKGMVEYTDMLIKDDRIMTIDLSYGIYMFYTNKYMIFPTLSKVKNTGYGAEGLNCKEIVYNKYLSENNRNYEYSKQPIDMKETFETQGDILDSSSNEIRKQMDNFFAVTPREHICCCGVWVLYKFLGRRATTRLIFMKRKSN